MKVRNEWKSEKRHKERKGLFLKRILMISILAIGGVLFFLSMETDRRGFVSFGDREPNTVFPLALEQKEEEDENWNLILINQENPLPEDFSVILKEIEDGYQVDERIQPYLKDMLAEARAQNVFPKIYSAYRTQEYQKMLFDKKVKAYRDEGHSKKKAIELAVGWVARPNTSEHQAGLAVDINEDKEYSTREEVYSWLKENAHRYGFILRYQEDKREITKVNYEPWHYRFVGEREAEEIWKSGECLEEYLKQREGEN